MSLCLKKALALLRLTEAFPVLPTVSGFVCQGGSVARLFPATEAFPVSIPPLCEPPLVRREASGLVTLSSDQTS